MNIPATTQLADAPAVAITIVCIALILGGIVTIVMWRRRESVWQRFANQHGLRVSSNELGPRISGRLLEFDFLLEILQKSSDTGPLGIEETRMSVQFTPADWPQEMRIESAAGLIGDVQQAVSPERILTDNAAFDREMLVTGTDAMAARDWLSPSRQLALLNLVSQHNDKHVLLSKSGLSLQTRTAVSQLRSLNDMLESLLETANASCQND